MSADTPPPPPPPPPPRDSPSDAVHKPSDSVNQSSDPVNEPIDLRAIQGIGPVHRAPETAAPSGEAPTSTRAADEGASLAASMSGDGAAATSVETPPPTADTVNVPASGDLPPGDSFDPVNEPIDLRAIQDIEPVHRPPETEQSTVAQDASHAEPDGPLTDTEPSQSSAELPPMRDPGVPDGGQPPPADGLSEPGRTTAEGDPPGNKAPPPRLEEPAQVLGLPAPYTVDALFEEPALSDISDHQLRSPDGLPTTGQDLAPPNADFISWPANSADADAWFQLPEKVREGFRGEVRMEEFHDGIGRIVGPDQSLDHKFWYRDADTPRSETEWHRGNAVVGQWNSGSSYEHLDGSDAPIKGWVGTTRGQKTEDGGWLPGGYVGIYIPPSEIFKIRDASLSVGKVPWRHDD